jgi:hypothetical protein
LQLVAIAMGVVMLSAISHVTLSTGQRPFQAINRHVNPALGWGWLLATCLANMIWIMPQFSLAFDAISKNLAPQLDSNDLVTRLTVSGILVALAGLMVYLNLCGGRAAKVFDLLLKAMIGTIVICFFGVVVVLIWQHGLPWQEILQGFIPNLQQWNQPNGKVVGLIAGVPSEYRDFWFNRIVTLQRDVMIGAAATAVGINMTFLLPYSMLARGWDKPFRGLAIFDLATGMAIPYVLVTSCVVIASAYSFHAQADPRFLSPDPAEVIQSPLYNSALDVIGTRAGLELPAGQWEAASSQQKAAFVAGLSTNERLLAATLSKRTAFQLSQALEPLLGPWLARQVFGVGVLGMGFSTIIILMLINGYAFREAAPEKYGRVAQTLGCVVAALSGLSWPLVWAVKGQEFWLSIVASTFGMMLLPVAYVAFYFLMNSRTLLRDDLPRGAARWVWNLLMGISVVGASVAATSAIAQKWNDPVAGPVVIGMATLFILAVLVGFVIRARHTRQTGDSGSST